MNNNKHQFRLRTLLLFFKQKYLKCHSTDSAGFVTGQSGREHSNIGAWTNNCLLVASVLIELIPLGFSRVSMVQLPNTDIKTKLQVHRVK